MGNFDFVGKNNFNGKDVPGLHSVVEHNLKAGDSVLITSDNLAYNGIATVLLDTADDGTYAGTIFLIDVPFAGSGSGTFEKISTSSASKDIVDKLRAGTNELFSPPNPGEDGGVKVLPTENKTPTTNATSTGSSNVTYYVIGGIALLALVLILRK